MKVLLKFNRNPYDGTDVAWNGLRLAGTLLGEGHNIRIFLMNDAIAMAKESCRPPEDYDQDLSQMLRQLIDCNVPVKVCGTCMDRSKKYKDVPNFTGAERSTISQLAEWVIDSDKVLSF